ncbi:MAG: PilZ domain-containing protein [Pseudomonadales bacterium]|nr:PilZ domain-containing protein [Pseudomonadales bacterium]
MIEQRKESRTHLLYYLRVFDRNSDTLFGHVVDLSPNGMLITSHKPLENQRTYKLAVEDVGVMDQLGTVNFEAECRWCKTDHNVDLYDAGFSLVNPSNQVQTLIADYV